MNFRILHYNTLDSTNTLAIKLAREGASEGAVVVSDYQTHGRGRFKRRWISPRGTGLLFSIILRPDLKPASAAILTHLAAQSVAEVLKEKFKLEAKLKKPNDVLIGGKKIAGILTEASGNQHDLDYVVVGIGLNVNGRRKGMMRSATSVYLEVQKRVDKEVILTKILSIFQDKYEHLDGKFVPIRTRCRVLNDGVENGYDSNSTGVAENV